MLKTITVEDYVDFLLIAEEQIQQQKTFMYECINCGQVVSGDPFNFPTDCPICQTEGFYTPLTIIYTNKRGEQHHEREN